MKKGRKTLGSSFTIFFANNDHNNCRFGVTVPQKLVRLATGRNLYKRQVKSMLISHLKSEEKKTPNSCQTTAEHSHSDLVIIIRHSYLKSDFATNQKKLYNLLDLVEQMKTKFRSKNNS